MRRQVAFLLAAVALPGAAGAQGFGADPAGAQGFGMGGPDGFTLYRGSEVRATYGEVREGWNTEADELALETRHLVNLAPFLGAQIDAGLRWLDLDDFAMEVGVHLHALSDDGSRFGVFYLPTWFEEDRLGEDRSDNYGIEGMFNPLPPLTVEARFGRFDGAVDGPYAGVNGYYALSPEIALTGRAEHTRLDLGTDDRNTTDVLVGAEYYIPASDIRVSGGLGFLTQSGDVDGTDVRVEVGATLFAFGEPATTARVRSFGRQRLPGTF